MKKIGTACLILAYRRHENALKILAKLSQSGIKEVYIAIDGPKSDFEYQKQEEFVRDAIEYCKIHFVNLRILRREKNQGIAVAVISAIDWFFKNEIRGIILEDDLEFATEFLEYADDALNFFKDDYEVWTVSGNQFFEVATSINVNSWCNYPLIWGWATWQDRWIEIRKEILSGSENILDFRLKCRVANFWKAGLGRSRRGQIDSWAVPFAARQRSLGKFTILPKANLVKNSGIENEASHSKKTDWHINREIRTVGTIAQFSMVGRSEISIRNNTSIEKFVYNIEWFHCLSNLKFLFLGKLKKPIFDRSLKVRLENVQSVETIYSFDK